MISAIAKRQLALTLRSRYCFSGGHHHKAYDWRDDYDLNPNYQRDPRRLGCVDPYTYSYPHEGPQVQTDIVFPSNYNPKDLTTNFTGTWALQSAAETNFLEVPHQVVMDDIAHEFDYES